MAGNATIRNKIVIEGEAQYKRALAEINRSYRESKSALKAVTAEMATMEMPISSQIGMRISKNSSTKCSSMCVTSLYRMMWLRDWVHRFFMVTIYRIFPPPTVTKSPRVGLSLPHRKSLPCVRGGGKNL